MRQISCWLQLLFCYLYYCGVLSIDPADYFSGAQHRPRLEILHPSNGQVLEDGDVTIKFKLDGYEMPSQFHGSSVCVGLTNSIDYTEKCFEEVPDFEFRAQGLLPGEQYALRVVLFERDHAIAISVRSFRVAGIRGLPEAPDRVVTIMTAVQVAIEYQLRGLEEQAELIYRSILSQQPQQADALHLLGVLLYQKGDPLNAVPYIELALKSNKTYEGFHNSLGVCYRALGRVEEAAHQFEMALAMQPNYLSAAYNLGLTYQQMSKWDAAIHLFQMITEVSQQEAQPQLSLQVRMESKVRECDLLMADRKLLKARYCLQQGITIFPDNEILPNELGNVFSQLGELEHAHVQYSIAARLGNSIAPLNIAHVLELQGYVHESRQAFEEVLRNATKSMLPTYHIKVRLAILSPRTFTSLSEIQDFRISLDRRITELMASGEVEIDNSPPLHFGFSTGNLFLYQLHDIDATSTAATKWKKKKQSNKLSTLSNKELKQKLYRLYISMCPALLQGFFLEKTEQTFHVDKEIVGTSKDTDEAIPQFEERAGKLDNKAQDAYHAAMTDVNNNAARIPATGIESGEDASYVNDGSTILDSSTVSNPISSVIKEDDGFGSAQSSTNEDRRKIVRIGFVSRFLNGHPAGLLTQGLISVLRNYPKSSNRAGSSASTQFEVFAFLVDGGEGTPQFDAVQKIISKHAHVVYSLPSNHIGACAQAIRSAELDVLVYPEIGMDPLSYFLSFARLAPVQSAWLGHPDTTGVPSVDYFISSDIEADGFKNRYSEHVHIMRNFGTQFLDIYDAQVKLQNSSPLLLQSSRATFLEQVNIPRNAHLYMVAQSLITLNPAFDEVISKILLQDRLGYIVVIDVSCFRPSWQNLFINRINGTSGLTAVNVDSIKQRIVFYTPESSLMEVDLLQFADVVLEPFPVAGNFQSALEALAIGVPVITMPSNTYVGGRFTLLLYKMLDYGYQQTLTAHELFGDRHHCSDVNDTSVSQVGEHNANEESCELGYDAADVEEIYTPLVVNTISEYVQLAMKITHQPKLRSLHAANIMRRRDRLFADDSAAVYEQWTSFCLEALRKAKPIDTNAPIDPSLPLLKFSVAKETKS